MPTSSRRYRVPFTDAWGQIRTGERHPKPRCSMVRRAGRHPRVRCSMVRHAGRCGHRPLQGAHISRTIPLTNPPAGLGGLWPSHRNNAKHGLSALPHFFQPDAPNHYKLPNLKSFTQFFSKNCRGPGGSAPGRPPQRAKYPLAAASETPSTRTGRNTRPSQRAKHPPAAAGEIPNRPKRRPQTAQSPAAGHSRHGSRGPRMGAQGSHSPSHPPAKPTAPGLWERAGEPCLFPWTGISAVPNAYHMKLR